MSVDELVTGVNIALGTLSPDACPCFDMDDNSRVTVDELITGVNNALYGCPGGEVSFDKVSLAILPGGLETVEVTAKDENGHPLGWTVTSSAPNVVSAVKNGAHVELTGLSLGSAAITVTTQSGFPPLRRSLPVRVYDPTVLDVGGLLIKYVDTFECIPAAPEHPEPDPDSESFYRPVVPEGWYALGSFRMDEAGCPSTDGKPNINGQQWMMVVKEAPQVESPLVTSVDESISGDLPRGDLSDPPRTLAFGVGDNQVRGSVLNEGDQWDQFDSFSFTLKAGEYLNSVVLKDFAGTFGGEIEFFTGTVATHEDPRPPTFLGSAPMRTDQIGTNYLAPGGLDPLGPGVYTIVIADYSFDASVQRYELVLSIGTQPIRPALAAPEHFQVQTGYWGWGLWAPVCPEGYVGMGTVMTTDDSVDGGPLTPPAKREARCVRRDLTVLAAPLPVKYPYSFSTARIEAAVNSDYATTKVYLDTGTMSAVFPKDSINPYPVNRVLAVELPLLVDTPYRNWYPHLTGPYDPPKSSEPVLAKAMLVPFTAILSGNEFVTKPVGWMVENSPFVRVERVQMWSFWKALPNSSTTQQNLHYETETGIDTFTSDTFSGTAGVSVTAEGGVKFLGTGGKLSGTLSFEFGYSHQTATTELTRHTVIVDLNAAPCTYLCVWGLQSRLVVKMLDDDTGQLASIASMEMSDYAESSVTYYFDDYPMPASLCGD